MRLDFDRLVETEQRAQSARGSTCQCCIPDDQAARRSSDRRSRARQESARRGRREPFRDRWAGRSGGEYAAAPPGATRIVSASGSPGCVPGCRRAAYASRAIWHPSRSARGSYQDLAGLIDEVVRIGQTVSEITSRRSRNRDRRYRNITLRHPAVRFLPGSRTGASLSNQALTRNDNSPTWNRIAAIGIIVSCQIDMAAAALSQVANR